MQVSRSLTYVRSVCSSSAIINLNITQTKYMQYPLPNAQYLYIAYHNSANKM